MMEKDAVRRSRRQVMLGSGAAAVLLSSAPQNVRAEEARPPPPPPGIAPPGCKVVSNPSTTTVRCNRTGRRRDGRLLVCRADENCVSCSSVKSPSKFGAPWSYTPETFSETRAWKSLKDTLLSVQGVELVEENLTAEDGTFYLHATAPALIPPGSVDDLEFVLNPKDKLVFYRSATRDTVFVYPLQQPVGDKGNNRARLESVRTALGWELLSYDLSQY